ncbi:hypothetical protein [Demequina zhanjiangensis]|uniref:Uncharacterized protein n=1 Tax=Demequina zhanjiangensis TaxID=3051659 RepID=A0ABT8G3I1_9MICO|nr:hypothetical protein [Demequina sp. SYSU T00b26]MDN4473572.1 hypothetical protein [Demequina sp. SYSU T00b26]
MIRYKEGTTSMNMNAYWRAYRATLLRVRAERPVTFAGLKVILDVFHAKSSGDAFFPGGADDGLDDALRDAGWSVTYEEGDYLWTATHPSSGASVHYVEGDVYCLSEGAVLL